MFLAVLVWAAVACSVSAEDWLPAPALAIDDAAEDIAPLPDSIDAEAVEAGGWRCTIRFRAPSDAERVVISGSFNGWDRQANPMKGPDAAGYWRATLDLPAGVHQYKFVVDDEHWYDDPVNHDRTPDGFGGFNSHMRLGRLTLMERSDAQLGDGDIAMVGLEHRPDLPLYLQAVSMSELLLRYRTLARDVEHISVAVRGEGLRPMARVSTGPLFTYWEAHVPVATSERAPKVRNLKYTFLLEDGDARACDPFVYNHSYTSRSVFETPEWAKHAIWYQIFPDRFRNGNTGNDPEHTRPWTSEWFAPSPWEQADGADFYEYAFDRFYGGDLAGIEARLPYLKELGVNALYLNPVFYSPSNHRYDVSSYVHIDPVLGVGDDYSDIVVEEEALAPNSWRWTESDQRFRDFVAKAHDMGFKVIVDLVLHHTGDQHPAYLDVATHGKLSPFADWYDVVAWEPEFACAKWANVPEMPSLATNYNGFAAPAVRQHFFDITQRWMDPDGDGDPRDGVDGWRLDVPNEVPLPFWAEWRRHVKRINPDAFITGEIWRRADQWLDGHHFDAVMNYQFAKTAIRWIINQKDKLSASAAAAELAELRLVYPNEATYALQTLVDSHDTDRLASMAQNPDRIYDTRNRVQSDNPDYDNSKPSAAAYARARLVVLLQMTYVGAPMIYYGDEVGMWGADDPSNRKPMLWSDLGEYAKPEENTVMAEQFEFYKRVIALRQAHSALRIGSFKTLLTDDDKDIWAFARVDDQESVVVVLNASDAAQEIAIPVPPDAPAAWTAIFGAEGVVTADDGVLTAQAPACGGVIYQAAAR